MEESEGKIQDKIVDYLNLMPHCLAYTTTTKGRVVGRTRIKAKKQERKGKSDVVCCYAGLYIAIEIKKLGEKQSKDQEIFEKDVYKAGGLYWIVTSLDNLKLKLAVLDDFIGVGGSN